MVRTIQVATQGWKIRLLGKKFFELSDHLGNVTMTVSDRKQLGGSPGGYGAQVLSYEQYYPFGSTQGGRGANSVDYRFGFNGKEDDREWGSSLIQDYGFRLYNPGIGKFLSTDPISIQYPELTPYQFASNRVIDGVDLDGLEYMSGFGISLMEVYKDAPDDVDVLQGQAEVVGAIMYEIAMPLRLARTGSSIVYAGIATNVTGSTYRYYDIYGNLTFSGNDAALQEFAYAATEEMAYSTLGGVSGHFIGRIAENTYTVINRRFIGPTGEYVDDVISTTKIPTIKPRIPCGCFIAGTIVKTQEGNKNIEDVKVGDWVWAYDDSTGVIGLKQVLQLHRYQRDTIYQLFVDDNKIEATGDHPFHVLGNYIEARYLQVGDILIYQTGNHSIVDSIFVIPGTHQVYNFTVNDYHTYFVGENGILVHNSGPCDVALGVRENLDDFAKATNSTTWKDWDLKSMYEFEGKFMKNVEKAKQIHFNLVGKDGKLLNVKKALKKKATPFTKTTNWELQTISKNADLLEKTTFYGEGGENITEQVREIIGK